MNFTINKSIGVTTKMPEVPISFVYSQRNLMPKRLRLLIDFLMAKLEEHQNNSQPSAGARYLNLK
ncbi:hypothetical protein E4T25_19195 [Photobacterium damselae subsp. piscicida]|nr:hypothetical protein E4T25_19195 [Photobacterium damselae subsp. piscicida]